MAEASAEPRPGVPVTTLCGFLGAGKTTTLKNLLLNRDGRRVAVIVNDMAALNVDGAIVEALQGGQGVSGGAASSIQLDNGCICCTLREELLTEVMKIAAKGHVDNIVVEASGIAEPQPLVEMLATAAGVPSAVHLDCAVTVVDAEKFLADFKAADAVGDRQGLVEVEGASADDRRTVVALLVDQVEHCNLIVLNKTDLVSEAELAEVMSLVTALNPCASLYPTTHGAVPLDVLLNNGLAYKHAAEQAAGTAVVVNNVKYTQSKAGSSGISSFVWKSDRLFHPARLHNLVCHWSTKRILRSKGFVWVQGHQDAVYWSHAGNHLALQPGPPWVPGAPHNSEVVFIGINMVESAIVDALQQCLVTEAESTAAGASVGEVVVVIDGGADSALRCVEEPYKLVQLHEEETVKAWLLAAYALALITIVYNIVEGVISITFAVEDEWDADLSLLGFGLDSLIEVLSACFVLLRFCRGRFGAPPDASNPSAAAMQATAWERQSMACIAVLLMGLGISAMAGGAFKIASTQKAAGSVASIIISALSLAFMWLLYAGKAKTAVILNSAVAEADAACTLGCIHLSLVLFVGSLLRRIHDSLWWIDGVAAILLGILILKEGVTTWRTAHSAAFDGCGCGNSGSFLIRRLHTKLRSGDGRLRSAVSAAAVDLSDPKLSKSGGQPVPHPTPVVTDIDAAQAAAGRAEADASQEAAEEAKASPCGSQVVA